MKISYVFYFILCLGLFSCKPQPKISNEPKAGKSNPLDSLSNPKDGNKHKVFFCGMTKLSPEQEKVLTGIYGDFRERAISERTIPGSVPEGITYPVYVHLLTPDSSVMEMADIKKAIAHLNENFTKINLRFALVGVDSILSDYYLEDFYNQIGGTEVEKVFDTFNKPKVLNIYITRNQPEASYLNGFTYPLDIMADASRNRDIICLSPRTFVNKKTLVHEVGHFMSLLHTFNVSNCSGCSTEELADKSNCTSTGDFICDTPADPADPNLLDVRGCAYTGDLKDRKGRKYAPMINNYMSYYDACCDYQFTAGQYDVMRRMAENYRRYLRRATPKTPTPSSPAVVPTPAKPVQTPPAATASTQKTAASTPKPATTPPKTAPAPTPKVGSTSTTTTKPTAPKTGTTSTTTTKPTAPKTGTTSTTTTKPTAPKTGGTSTTTTKPTTPPKTGGTSTTTTKPTPPKTGAPGTNK